MQPERKSEGTDTDEDTTDRKCVDCGRCSPANASEYTLFSSKYGWRITRGVSASGEILIEWHCPECFARLRAQPDPER